ncbi:MAG: helix-hairpin-helix domain-containing protein [Bacteroidales bacterium]|nr:helix-hairpin-helix domain-containing protein [Bacteroidales bacterium]
MEEMDENGRAVGLRWCLGLLTALWAPLRRYFYLTKRDAQGFAVWCVLMALTLGVKWAYPRWEAARLSEDRLPAAAVMPAAGAGTGGFAATGTYNAPTGGFSANGNTSAMANGGSRGASGGAPAPDTASPARPSPRAASRSPYGSPYRKKTFTVDLNRGDTLDFQELRGIGPAYARRIVAYRERLGGFVDKAQLLEVWGVDSALYARIAPSLELGSGPVRPLYINRMSVQELKQHPYLDYYQAKEIVRYRERYGAFQTPADLRKVNLLDAETCARLAPYISTSLPDGME